ncbi:peptidoglycan-binding protein LysM [Sphingomicrobium lutaoense]|uniref:Potassium binding protein Kbp n=1 Tax=Sphingomicrobium lutaoense TaxID=515949 RepID=A0A839Z0Y1_9SPHN|nr:peptidoglycan-binding protein LysM [Sphingomicrobium lutaoense]MBB3763333.1 nucleoid-associated protein YgaU [Sphingomicrobium lutaoense]
MGIFDMFKKDKGKELFDEQTPAEKKAEALRKEIEKAGIGGDIKVRVEGNRVKISGKVPDQASKEKLMVITGNTKHIDSVDDDDLQGGDGSPGRFHTVESGDTLSAIAKKYYGNANDYMRIFEANRPMLSDPDKIYPGQVLRIPTEKATA